MSAHPTSVANFGAFAKLSVDDAADLLFRLSQHHDDPGGVLKSLAEISNGRGTPAARLQATAVSTIGGKGALASSATSTAGASKKAASRRPSAAPLQLPFGGDDSGDAGKTSKGGADVGTLNGAEAGGATGGVASVRRKSGAAVPYEESVPEEAGKEGGGEKGGAPVGDDRDDEDLEVAEALAALNRKGKRNVPMEEDGEDEDTGSAGGVKVAGPGSGVEGGGSDANKAGGTNAATKVAVASGEGGANHAKVNKEPTITFLGKVLDVKKIPAHVKPILRDPATNRSKRTIHRGATPRGKRWESQIAFNCAIVGLGTHDTELQAASVYAWAYSLLHGVEAMDTARREGEEAVEAHKEAVEAKQNAPPPKVGDVPVPRITPRAWARKGDEEKKNLAWKYGYEGDVNRFENEALELEVVEPPSVEKKRSTRPSCLRTPAGQFLPNPAPEPTIVSEDSVKTYVANEGEIVLKNWVTFCWGDGRVNGFNEGGMYYLWRDGFFNQGMSDADMGARAFAHHSFTNGKEGTMINTVPTSQYGHLAARLAEAEDMMKFYGFLLDKLIHGENFWCDSKEDVEEWISYVLVFDKTGKLDIALGDDRFISIDSSSKQYWKLHEKFDEWWPIAYPMLALSEERKQEIEAFRKMSFEERVKYCKQKYCSLNGGGSGVAYEFIKETIEKRNNNKLSPQELNVLAEVGYLEMSYSDRVEKNAMEAFEMRCRMLRRYQAMDGKGKGAFPLRDRYGTKPKDRVNPKWVDSTVDYLVGRLRLCRGTYKGRGGRPMTTEMRAVLVDEFGLEAFKDQPEELEESEEPEESEEAEDEAPEAEESSRYNLRKRKREEPEPAPEKPESEELDGSEEDESAKDPDDFCIECTQCTMWDRIHKRGAGFGLAEAEEKDWLCWRCTDFDLRYDLLSAA